MPVDASDALLRWYDENRRRLPWRALPGERPDAYRVWLSEIMLQQTTVAAVRPYFESFVRRWPTVEAFAAADDDEIMAAWAGLGYYARARNMIAAARKIVTEGGFPRSEEALRALPGIGRYTAAAIAAIAFGQDASAVDGNVERVTARLFAFDQPLPRGRPALHALAATLVPSGRAGDFAQAMMDLGSTVCTARAPACVICPLLAHCAAGRSGAPELYPIKAPKGEKPRRVGIAYWLEHGGDVLLVRRPGRGLLGGMLGLPTGDWNENPRFGDGAPGDGRWIEAGSIEHVFTHFALTLRLVCAEAEEQRPAGVWWPVAKIGEAGLPTVFAKLARRGAEWRRAA